MAFRGPATLTARLGYLDAARIAAISVDDFVAVCCDVRRSTASRR